MAEKGDRVRLIATNDPHVTLAPGVLGTVMLVDDIGTVHVRWDNGTELGLVADEDAFELVDESVDPASQD
jgi:Domain of unknown function (DUF4314)